MLLNPYAFPASGAGPLIQSYGEDGPQADPHPVAYPSGITAGDLLLGTATSAEAISLPAGFTLLESFVGFIDHITFHKTSAGTESGNLMLDLAASTQTAAVLMRIDGHDPSGTILSDTVTGTLISPSLTAPTNNSLLISIIHATNSDSAVRTFTKPPSMTLLVSAVAQFNFRQTAVAWEVVPAGATGTREWTVDTVTGTTRHATSVLIPA